jgi:outer membrane murein-binding lipoprotein Lpp
MSEIGDRLNAKLAEVRAEVEATAAEVAPAINAKIDEVQALVDEASAKIDELQGQAGTA